MSSRGRATMAANGGKACYQCGSRDHLVSFHKRDTSNTSGVGRGGRKDFGTPSARVNKCMVQSVESVADVDDERWSYDVDPSSLACDVHVTC